MSNIEIYILIIALVVYAVVVFVSFSMGQSRMRRLQTNDIFNLLVEARNINGNTGRQKRRMDKWLTDKINAIVLEKYGKSK